MCRESEVARENLAALVKVRCDFEDRVRTGQIKAADQAAAVEEPFARVQGAEHSVA